MGFWQHDTEFEGFQISDFFANNGLKNLQSTCPALRVDYDDEHTVVDTLGQLLACKDADQIQALVIGVWASGAVEGGGPEEIVEALVSAADQLPSLRALFFGDIISEECEISWINQGDISPLFTAYPKLEVLKIRGSNNLKLGAIDHAHLKKLIIQSGGISTTLLNEVLTAKLPNLEHLELFLGTDYYGGDTSVADLEPLLAGKLFPKLSFLGLKDCDYADELAQAVATSAVLGRIKVLDLSMGTLGTDGVNALAASPNIAKLKMLDLHHHYASTEAINKLNGLGIEVDASDPQGESDPDDRYVSVGE